MSTHGKRNGSVRLTLAVILAMAVMGPASAQPAAPRADRPAVGGPHEHLDARFSNNHYYYDRGYAVHRPPRGAYGELRGPRGGRYWYDNGNWYRWGGRDWTVWAAPVGLFVPWLPPYFTTVWWYGVPYYYANDTYYTWSEEQRQYQVVAPPDGIEASGVTHAPASDQLFIYPKNAQSSEQQAKDNYECHHWAVEQSGFDPTVAGGGVAPETAVRKRNDYFRAQVTCLEARGYSVK